MPKGKILMGKGPVKKPAPVKPSPKGMVNPGKKRALPMPKAKPGKPAPKGGTVIERKLENNEQRKGGPLSLAELRKRNTIGGAGSVKTKPVMPRRGGK